VNQRSALQCVVGALTPKMATRYPAQLIVNQGNQRFPRFLIALAPVDQQLADPFG
jgi:hypothetical protein